MLHIFAAPSAVLTLVTIGVEFLQTAQVVSFRTGIFRSGKAEVMGTLGLTVDGLQRLDVFTLLGHTDQFQGVFCARHSQIGAV